MNFDSEMDSQAKDSRIGVYYIFGLVPDFAISVPKVCLRPTMGQVNQCPTNISDKILLLS